MPYESPEVQAIKGDRSLVDPDLHPTGVQQCHYNAPKCHAINFTRVIVSPMNRAMQTAIHMFKGHPNVKNIVFTVLPLVHEVFHTSNDAPQDVYELMKRYAPGAEDAEGLMFDFSIILNSADP
jgi:broad specificity phosphatase PhoE